MTRLRILFAALPLLAFSCNLDVEPDDLATQQAELKKNGCEYDGKGYKKGSSFPSSDGCNTCSCVAKGSVVCTQMACSNGCTVDGKQYAEGQSFPSSDGCNTCSCVNGSALCSKSPCQSTDGGSASGTCSFEGKSYVEGDAFPAPDGCNNCGCNDGSVLCTAMACP